MKAAPQKTWFHLSLTFLTSLLKILLCKGLSTAHHLISNDNFRKVYGFPFAVKLLFVATY